MSPSRYGQYDPDELRDFLDELSSRRVHETVPPEREHIQRWVAEETLYATAKFQGQRGGHDAEMRKDGIDDVGWWLRQIFQYVDRARIFGLDTFMGRQAMMKCYMTLGGFIESMVRVHGSLPTPGVTSGEIREWSE